MATDMIEQSRPQSALPKVRGRVYWGGGGLNRRNTATRVISDIEPSGHPSDGDLEGQGAHGTPKREAKLIQRRAKLRTSLAQGKKGSGVIDEKDKALAPKERAKEPQTDKRYGSFKEIDGAPAPVAPATGETTTKPRANRSPKPRDKRGAVV